mmetsp:Transcript_19651/g.35762  ORF Transcript_19651/g.35762 Transcript_19651/m.35762 type:complete len:227 (+) Transcript_19651:128-808(+)
MTLCMTRSMPHMTYVRNYNWVIMKEKAAEERSTAQWAAPDPLASQRSELPTSGRRDSARSLQASEDKAPQAEFNQPTWPTQYLVGPAPRKTQPQVRLSRSASEPAKAPLTPTRAEVSSHVGGGLLGKPNYFVPPMDGSYLPKPVVGGRRDVPDDYAVAVSSGTLGIMMWADGKSHRKKRSTKRTSSRPLTPIQLPSAKLSPPPVPENGFGAKPAHVLAKDSKFYWG